VINSFHSCLPLNLVLEWWKSRLCDKARLFRLYYNIAAWPVTMVYSAVRRMMVTTGTASSVTVQARCSHAPTVGECSMRTAKTRIPMTSHTSVLCARYVNSVTRVQHVTYVRRVCAMSCMCDVSLCFKIHYFNPNTLIPCYYFKNVAVHYKTCINILWNQRFGRGYLLAIFVYQWMREFKDLNSIHVQLNFVMSKWSGPRKILRHRNGST